LKSNSKISETAKVNYFCVLIGSYIFPLRGHGQIISADVLCGGKNMKKGKMCKKTEERGNEMRNFRICFFDFIQADVPNFLYAFGNFYPKNTFLNFCLGNQ
jgi:hypothetical protein